MKERTGGTHSGSKYSEILELGIHEKLFRWPKQSLRRTSQMQQDAASGLQTDSTPCSTNGGPHVSLSAFHQFPTNRLSVPFASFIRRAGGRDDRLTQRSRPVNADCSRKAKRHWTG